MKILDCTLRDGGYYNNWYFSDKELQEYFKFVKENPIDIIEIGFRFIKKNKFHGPFAFSSEQFLQNIVIPKNKKISVMINAKDYFNDIKLINNYFSEKKNSKIDIVRIAINYKDFAKAKILCSKFKKLGYKVGLNLMQAHNIDNEYAKKNFKKISLWGTVDVLYFADSLGCMDPHDINKICDLFKKYWNKIFGIHAHNNKGIALLNSKIAIENGATWIDSTILGMGRGAGNVSTESLLIDYEKILNPKKIKLYNLESFQKLKTKYNWGYNPYYHFSAIHKIHPTYVQTLIEDDRYKDGNIYEYLRNLSFLDPSSFDENLIEGGVKEVYNNNFRGENIPKDLKDVKDLILIGSGPSVKNFKHFIENYIKKTNFRCLSLNYNRYVDPKNFYAFVISHISRINIEIDDILNTKKKIISPQSIINKFNLPKKYSISYGLKITDGNFKSNARFCEIPSPIVLSYILQLLKQTKVNNIYFAGIDGYDDLSKNKEIYDCISNFKNFKKKVNLYTITPSKINLFKNKIIY